MLKRLAFAILTIAVIIMFTLFLKKSQKPLGNDVLVLSGGTMRPVVEDILARYRAQSPDSVIVTYGDSAELCAQISNTRQGDIFICHDPFMPWAAAKNLVTDWKAAAYLDNVIAVPKGNPNGVRGLEDLGKPGVRLGIGDRRYSTSGVMVKQILERVPFGVAVSSNVIDEARGHQERCTAVALGALDATITWKPVAVANREKLDMVPLSAEGVDAVTSATYGQSDLRNVALTVGIVRHDSEKPATRRFYEYMTTQCGDLFEKHGFRLTKH
jgi:molybdate transport system substrate-binding protein